MKPVSVMSVELFYELNGGELEECNLRLKTYTGEIMRPLGVGWLDVDYNGMKVKLPIIVLEGSVPTLMGRNWLSVLNIDSPYGTFIYLLIASDLIYY